MPININTHSANHTTLNKRAGEQKNITKIDSKIDKSAASPIQDRTQESAKATLSPDSVNLTVSSAKIKALEEQVARLPIVDSRKIEEIKNSIDAGTFEVNPERVAEKMIQFEREFQR